MRAACINRPSFRAKIWLIFSAPRNASQTSVITRQRLANVSGEQLNDTTSGPVCGSA